MKDAVQKHGVVEKITHILADADGFLDHDTMSTLMSHCSILKERTNHRGLTASMVTLPKLGKAFDKGLSSGFFSDDCFRSDPHIGVSGSYLFEPLIRYTFSRAGRLISPDPVVIRLTRSILYAFKKVTVDAPLSIVRKAHHEFFELDDNLRNPTLNWGCDPEYQGKSILEMSGGLSFQDCLHSTSDRALLDLAAILDLVSSRCIPLREFNVYDTRGKHGPGAVADQKSNSDKYEFPSWSSNLSKVFPPSVMMTTWGIWESEIPDHWGDEIALCKLIAVPKTIDKPRLIASEPVANMWCQQALLGWIRKNLPSLVREHIDFFDQTPSQELALLASSLEDSSLATVDLSSASDRLSCWTVERMFRKNPTLIEAMMSSRSLGCYSELTGRCSPRLRKYAAQGNATTFPVQSIVYLVCALTASIYAEGFRPSKIQNLGRYLDRERGRVRVFGDDIILSSNAVIYLELIFNMLQLKINRDKTHTTGHFRESCGMDAYGGVDVTPFYFSSPFSKPTRLSELASWCEVTNNATRRGYTTLAYHLWQCIPKRLRGLIPFSNLPQAGLYLLPFTDAIGLQPGHKRRWNSDLQTFEYLGLVPISKLTVEAREACTNLLQYFTEASCGGLTFEAGLPVVVETNGKVGYASLKRHAIARRWVPLYEV